MVEDNKFSVKEIINLKDAKDILSNSFGLLDNLEFNCIFDKLYNLFSDNIEDLYYVFYKKLGWGDIPIFIEGTKITEENWSTIDRNTEYKLRIEFSKGHDDFARIVSDDNVLVGIGSKSIMYEKFVRLTRECFFQKGDIIAIDRNYIRKEINGVVRDIKVPVYAHYAIYRGDGKIIHFAAKNDDFGTEKSVRVSPMEDFLFNGEYNIRDCYVLHVIYGKAPQRIYQNMNELRKNFAHINFPIFNDWSKSVIYNENESIARAEAVALDFDKNADVISSKEERKKINSKEVKEFKENCYNLWNNNCEHFALWCRTGQKESIQIENAKKVLLAVAAGIIAVLATRNRK